MTRAIALIAASAAILLAGMAGTATASHYNHLLAPKTKCGGWRQTDQSLPPAEQELVMHCLHNWARAKAGRSALDMRAPLTESADRKTADMMRCRQFSHQACGRDTLYHVHAVGYTSGGCWGAAENITWGSGREYATVRSRMASWLHSTDHRTTILDARYRDLGLGLRKGTFLGNSGAAVWTGHFGYRC